MSQLRKLDAPLRSCLLSAVSQKKQLTNYGNGMIIPAKRVLPVFRDLCVVLQTDSYYKYIRLCHCMDTFSGFVSLISSSLYNSQLEDEE